MCSDRELYGRYRKELERLLELTPSYPDLLNRRGLIHYCEGDFEAARADFLQALSRDPGYEEARVNLAFTLEEADLEGALHVLSSVAKRSSHPVLRFVDAACFCFHVGRTAEARSALDHAMALDKAHPLPYHFAAFFALRAGDSRQARLDLLQATRRRGGCLEGYSLLGIRDGEKLHPDRLESQLLETCPNPRFQTIHVAVARWLAEKGDTSGASKELLEILKYDPRVAPYYRARGDLEVRRDRPRRAERWLRRALETEPKDPSTHASLAQAYAALGDDLCRERHLVQAIELNPNFPDLHYDLAGICAQTGRLDEALRSLRSCLAIHPSFHKARLLLGECLLRSGEVSAAREQLQLLPPELRHREDVQATVARSLQESTHTPVV